MKKDFKRAGYLAAILVFFLGIGALVISSISHYFSYSDSVVVIGEFVAFVAFIILIILCVFAKNDYNYVCTRFADYIIDSRKKEASYQENEAEHMRQIQNMRAAADQDRQDAVTAALEQGRSEGAQAALESMGSSASQIPTEANASNLSAPQDNRQPSPMPHAYSPAYPQTAQQPVMPQPRAVSGYMQPITPNDEVLYNEYGEPVMIRRRVRRTRESMDNDVLYDRYGNPVARRATISPQNMPTAAAPQNPPADQTTQP